MDDIKTIASRIAAGVFVFGGLISLPILISISTGGAIGSMTGFIFLLCCYSPVLSVTVTAGIFWIAIYKNILSIALNAAAIGAIGFFILVLILMSILMFREGDWPRYEPLFYALSAVPLGVVVGAIIGTIVGLVKSKLGS